MLYRRFRIPLVAVALALLLGAVGGCGHKDEDSQVLATIGDRTVDVEYYKSRLVKLEENQLPRDDQGNLYDLATLEGKRAFLNVIIDKELMVAKALQLGYDQDPQVDAALKSLTEYQAMIFFWADEIGDPSRFVSDEDVDYYYSRLGERRDCHFIITDLQADAEAAVKDARAGVPWSEIVAKYHDGLDKNDKEPVISVAWGQYRDEFEEPVFAPAEGGITDPIPTEHGWWVLRIDKVSMEDKPALESIKDRVLMSIAKRHENLRREELLRRVREERHFKLNENALKIVFDGLPADEPLVDPATQKPIPQDQLQPLQVPTSTYGEVVMSYDLSTGPVTFTVSDLKSQFDRQNVFERPKKGELLGGLRSKLTAAAERSIMVDEARKRGYFEDERVIRAAYRQVEEMLVDKVHADLIKYDETVTPAEIDTFWTAHSAEYERPERRTGQMVLCKDRATAEQARAAIASGESTWKAVNNRFGSDPELAKSFGRFPLVPATETGPLHDVLFAQQLDDVSQPFELRGGWAVVQLTKIVPPESPTLDEMAEAVAQRIRNRRMDVALRKDLDDWAAEFGVHVNEELLAKMPSWREAKQEATDKRFAAATPKG
ncbi:MAG: peptidylprolyl isomerase [Candidatus Krumholzibacteriia bacterium]